MVRLGIVREARPKQLVIRQGANAVYLLVLFSFFGQFSCNAFQGIQIPTQPARIITRTTTTTCFSTAEAAETTSASSSYRAPVIEINRRRNLAIISHPDSGKTTMTEKLLLYGGALQQAGAVRQKAEQRATQSDFMELEQERGISISSTVMNFEYNGFGLRLMDTPGHQDFSEDTYRALAAADNALMLLDAAKGLEPQTRKLFEVCRLRNLPLFTFCNKMDRPALAPYEIMDQIEAEFGLQTYPVLWPIGDGDRFKVNQTEKNCALYDYHLCSCISNLDFEQKLCTGGFGSDDGNRPHLPKIRTTRRQSTRRNLSLGGH